jgi:hypothetical protein
MAACPLATLDRETFNQEVIGANVVAGEGLFVHELRRALCRRGIQMPFQEQALGPAMASRRGIPGAGPNRLPDPPGSRPLGAGDRPVTCGTGGPRETGPVAAS